jgi:glycosyltransferase involved in cell wall biosynthesis
MIDISIVIPVYNEVESIPHLAGRIREAMSGQSYSYECVWVDDGSQDGSQSQIELVTNQDPHARAIYFRRNFGQTAALKAGFDHANGKIIVTLDADLQNDPQDIPMLITKIEEGYDLVSGWRKNRQDSWIRNFPSHLANFVISKVTGVYMHDSGCTLKAYRREVIEDLNLYGEMHRFIPALASWRGIRMVEVPVRHHARAHGQSKYGLSRTFRVVLDLITVKFLLSYSSSPIQIFGKIGLWNAAFGWLALAVTIGLKLTQGRTLTGNPFFYVFIFEQIIAVQFILIGLLGEMNMRIYYETQNKPTYIIRKTNIDSRAS